MKKISYKNISEELIMRITEEYIAYKNNNKVTKDKRNIVNKIGRPNKISIRKAVIYAYKIINGSKLEDLVEDIKEISSYQKYIRSIKTSGILTNIFKDTINNLNNEKKIDLTCIHIDSTNILNLNGHEDVSFGIKFKGKKSTKIHLAISNNYIPLSVHITGGNINDTSELNVNLKNIPLKLESSNKKPIYITTDKGYYSKNNFDIIETEYKLKLLCYPKKNLKKNIIHNKIMFNRMKRSYNQHKYSQRLKVERTFSILKKFSKINIRTDKKSNVYLGTIMFAILNMIYLHL
jgi:hypothetical protein